MPNNSNAYSELPCKEEDRGYKTPCWIWTSAIDSSGYGHFFYQGKNVRAHRASYQRCWGELPNILDHLCEIRSCINPLHLEPSTNAENIRRGRRTKIKGDDVSTVFRLRKEGMSTKEIASRYGVWATTIWMLLKNKHWLEVYKE